MTHSKKEIERLYNVLALTVAGYPVGMADARGIAELMFDRLCILHGVTTAQLARNPVYVMGLLLGLIASEKDEFARTAILAGNTQCLLAEQIAEQRAGIHAQIEKTLAEMAGNPVTEN